MNYYHPAWECKCQFCTSDSQFYSASKSSHINYYTTVHNGKNPWEFLGCNKKETNSVLCDDCHNEIKFNNIEDIKFARCFAFRNGFGPVPYPPPQSPNEDENFTIYRKLHSLMKSLTAAEEAAIRQITPLISIVRLTHGNIGSKGNTGCVWQQSKLNLILPNLPEECKFIIITRLQKKEKRYIRIEINKV